MIEVYGVNYVFGPTPLFICLVAVRYRTVYVSEIKYYLVSLGNKL